MTTIEATEILAAEELKFRFHPSMENWTDERVEKLHKTIAQAMGQAYEMGRKWNWSAAEGALNHAYAALGATNPGTGYDWHKGTHPIQIARQTAKVGNE